MLFSRWTKSSSNNLNKTNNNNNSLDDSSENSNSSSNNGNSKTEFTFMIRVDHLEQVPGFFQPKVSILLRLNSTIIGKTEFRVVSTNTGQIKYNQAFEFQCTLTQQPNNKSKQGGVGFDSKFLFFDVLVKKGQKISTISRTNKLNLADFASLNRTVTEKDLITVMVHEGMNVPLNVNVTCTPSVIGRRGKSLDFGMRSSSSSSHAGAHSKHRNHDATNASNRGEDSVDHDVSQNYGGKNIGNDDNDDNDDDDDSYGEDGYNNYDYNSRFVSHVRSNSGHTSSGSSGGGVPKRRISSSTSAEILPLSDFESSTPVSAPTTLQRNSISRLDQNQSSPFPSSITTTTTVVSSSIFQQQASPTTTTPVSAPTRQFSFENIARRRTMSGAVGNDGSRASLSPTTTSSPNSIQSGNGATQVFNVFDASADATLQKENADLRNEVLALKKEIEKLRLENAKLKGIAANDPVTHYAQEEEQLESSFHLHCANTIDTVDEFF